MAWMVGDGELISAWNDPWLSSSQQLRPMGPVPEAYVTLKVSDLMLDGSTEWDQAKVRHIFPELAETILSIKPSCLGAPDKQFWVHTRDGVYTIKSGYTAAVEWRAEREDRPQPSHAINWNKGVWNLKTAPKIQLLVWKALRGALPVGEQLLARQVTTDPACKRCGKLESIDHLLFQCEFAEQVWKEAPFLQQVDMRRLLDLDSDWMHLITNPCLPPVGIVTGQLASWIVWALWTARNKLIFTKKLYSVEEVITHAVSAAREWLNAQEKEQRQNPMIRVKKAPNPRDIVVQTDAAWKGDSRTMGLGWTIKTGESFNFQSVNRFVNSPLAAEGLAAREAIKKCKELGLRRIRIESDSAQLIKALNSTMDPPEIYGIITDIRIVCLAFESVSFSWIPRAGNSVADGLAKHALALYQVV
ncbi:uncharacterized protein LOC108839076 [Raphanus sativus]|uniref:Uncharacterized protein LOC108839076 n=1 Tax=Raphanus sativus TaxID=3726 RepID=A0A6J0M637_RAPSA|nr:uncharacterized protein LOC108839076 [Raphanus sativus]